MKPERINAIRRDLNDPIGYVFPNYTIRDLLDALESAQKEIAQLSEARRVVPELTEDDLVEMWSYCKDTINPSKAMAIKAWNLAVSRLQIAASLTLTDLTTEEAKKLVQSAIDSAIEKRGGTWDWSDLIEFGFRLAASRLQSIPANRVLGDGEVGVNHGKLKRAVDLVTILDCECSDEGQCDRCAIIDALANAQAKGVEG